MIDSLPPEWSVLEANYRSTWDKAGTPLERVAQFLARYSSSDGDGHHCPSVAQLACYDMTLAWSLWAIEVDRGGQLLSDDQLIAMLAAQPTAKSYEPLLCERCRSGSRWDKMVDCEAEVRAEYGDAVVPTYFYEAYDRVPDVTPAKPRVLTVQFDSRVVKPTPANLKIALRGQVEIGRQAQNAPDFGFVETKAGAKVYIAPREERMISRHQLVIRLLTPDRVLISNVALATQSADSARESLAPGKSQLVCFPFIITLSGRKLLGS